MLLPRQFKLDSIHLRVIVSEKNFIKLLNSTLISGSLEITDFNFSVLNHGNLQEKKAKHSLLLSRAFSNAEFNIN